MAGEKILIVDDDPGLLLLMRVRLEAAGYQVMQAEGGQEALTYAQEEACDLALVDLKMVDMDGITLLQELLRLHPGLPVIILTAHGTIASAVDATKKGAYDYLTKPLIRQTSYTASRKPRGASAPRGGTVLTHHGAGALPL